MTISSAGLLDGDLKEPSVSNFFTIDEHEEFCLLNIFALIFSFMGREGLHLLACFLVFSCLFQRLKACIFLVDLGYTES